MNTLYIKDENSLFDLDTKLFDTLFNTFDIVMGSHDALENIDDNDYNMVINDITVDAIEGIKLITHMRAMKPKLAMVVLVSSKDEDKIGGLIESGIHIFVVSPDQLEQALEQIADFAV